MIITSRVSGRGNIFGPSVCVSVLLGLWERHNFNNTLKTYLCDNGCLRLINIDHRLIMLGQPLCRAVSSDQCWPRHQQKSTCSIDQPWLREKMIKADQVWSTLINHNRSDVFSVVLLSLVHIIRYPQFQLIAPPRHEFPFDMVPSPAYRQGKYVALMVNGPGLMEMSFVHLSLLA